MSALAKKKKQNNAWDGKKESIFRQLSEVISSKGFKIRREALKSGFGWRVMSGACEYSESNYIFIDKRLTQDDQIDFLIEKAKEFGLTISESEKELLPKSIKDLL